MNRKERLYAVIGGCVGAVLTMLFCSFLPLGAQSRGDNFGDITCTGLSVMQPDIPVEVSLTPESIAVTMWGDDCSLKSGVRFSVNESGGLLNIIDKEGKTVVSMNTDTDGGKVAVYSNDKEGRGVVGLVIDEHGGRVDIRSSREPSTFAQMCIEENGAAIILYGRGGAGSVQMGINEYGSGVVSTWDKNGYRLK